MAQRYTLDSGLELVVEQMPACRSVACGVWARAGSAWEDVPQAGISHFLEHMLFKGTERRNAKQIAAVMDAVGGMINAFTGKEYTCYYTRALDEHFSLSLDLLADLYLHSQLADKEFALEKDVIIEEINMYEDAPDDLVGDLFAATLWPGHPYGRPVIGSKESVGGLSREALAAYYHANYAPANTVLAIAGNIAPEQALAEVEHYFGGFCGSAPRPSAPPAATCSQSAFINKDIEQVHVCLGFPGIAEDDPDYYAAHILNSIMGGGMSSRLFQEVREKRGLSYSAYSYLSSYAQGGYYSAYASTRPNKLQELVQVLAQELLKARQQGLSDQELDIAQQQLKGNLLLGLENSGNVMNRSGKMLLTLNKLYSAEETLAKLMAVTPADLRRVAERILEPSQAVLAVVGPVEQAIELASIW